MRRGGEERGRGFVESAATFNPLERMTWSMRAATCPEWARGSRSAPP
ncbi:MAG: hypothetical protein R3A52_31700 [Polyangiales bacterium]